MDQTAFDADLPPGVLVGAGVFADVALEDEVRLPLARASAEHTSAQESADLVAERAVAHPLHKRAMLLSMLIITSVDHLSAVGRGMVH
ncbi:hypothetical protein ACWEQC_26080 [Streptomyces shenzhenensis]